MSFSQQGRSNTRALKSHYPRPFQFVGEQGCYHELFPTRQVQYQGSEKSLSPPIPVCGGAVVTNDVHNVQSMKGYEPRHEKTNVLVSDLVRHKPGCTALEDG